MSKYIDKYKFSFVENLSFNLDTNVKYLSKLFSSIKKSNKKIIFFGNGGSASICNHLATDLTKVGGVRAISIADSNYITCLANDYGYENWVKKSIEFYYLNGDHIILISSSGTSKNMINAAKYCKNKNIKFTTMFGFSDTKPKLSSYGSFKIPIKSKNFNIIENSHQFILLASLDLFLKTSI